MTEYLRWHRHLIDPTFASLMPRETFEAWLYRLFLKLAIPKEREPRDFVLIYSPLNSTAIVRLCHHLQTLGYLAHWMGVVLDSILFGRITTRARPPRSEPLKLSEVAAEGKRPLIEQCTAPFIAELSTLVGMWQCVLPYGILSSGIPTIGMVHWYTVQFEDVQDFIGETPSFVLLLFHTGQLPSGFKSIRPYLVSDEKADRSTHGKAVRERGLHILTTWSWHRPSKTATFWLRRDVLESLRTGNWAIAVWRTDNWIPQSLPMRVSDDIRDHGPWLREVA